MSKNTKGNADEIPKNTGTEQNTSTYLNGFANAADPLSSQE